MLCPPGSALALILGLLLCPPAAARGSCWGTSRCRDLSSQPGVLACAVACRAELSAEAPVSPGQGHLQPLPVSPGQGQPLSLSPGQGHPQPLPESLRRYVMSHFRWSKFGRSNTSTTGHKRGAAPGGNPPLGSPLALPWPPSLEEEEGKGLEREEGKRSYSMEHFRWGKPVGRKRRPVKVYPNGAEEEEAESYPVEFRRELAAQEEEEEEEEGQEEEEEKAGGSYGLRQRPWQAPAKDKRYGGFMSPEQGQTPLVTLFRNTILKSAYKKGQ